MSILTALAGAVAVLVAALVKGAIGFGFPLIATPLLALVVDVRTAVAVLLLPNIVMDVVQVARRGSVGATVRRLWLLLAAGVVGMALGTRQLVTLDPRVATGVLGACLLVFVALNRKRVPLRVPGTWEPWLSPVAGVLAGLIGGVTNVPGPPLVLYFFKELRAKGISLHVAGAHTPVVDFARKTGLFDLIGEDHFHLTMDAAVQAIEAAGGENIGKSQE